MKKINISDLFEQEDVFKGIRKSAIDTIETLQKVQSELKESAKVIQNDIKNSSTNSARGLKDFSDAAKAASQVMKDSATIAKQQAQAEQQRIKVDQELIKLEKLKAQELARANKEAEKAAAAAAKLAKETANQNSAYKQLEKSTRDLKNQSKELGAQLLAMEKAGQRGTAAYANLEKQFVEVTNEARKLDAELKDVDKSVGDNFRNVGNYEGATRNLKTELRALTRELMNMETSDPRFQEMTQRAGELKDQISDTQAVVKATAGSAMENFAGATAKVGQIGVAAFQGMESSMVLLGVQNEAVLESMQKLQALAGLGDALQTLGGLGDMLTEIRAGFTAAISKIVAFTTAKNADTAATVANATATEAQGAATVATTAATTGATGAMKLLRLALIGTGIGALIIGLGLLVANFDKVMGALKPVIDGFKSFSDWIGITNFKQAEQDEKVKKSAENRMAQIKKEKELREKTFASLERNYSSQDKAMDRQIKLLKAQGKDTTTLERARLKATIRYQTNLQAETYQMWVQNKEKNKLILAELRAIAVREKDFTEYNKFLKESSDSQNELAKENLQAKEARLDAINELAVFEAEVLQAAQENYTKNENKTAAESIDIKRRLEDEKMRLEKESRQKELTQLEIDYKRKREDAANELKNDAQKGAKLAQLDAQWTENKRADRKAINDKWDKIELDAEKKMIAEMRTSDQENYEIEKQLRDAQTQNMVEGINKEKKIRENAFQDELWNLQNMLDEQKISREQYDEFVKQATTKRNTDINEIENSFEAKRQAAKLSSLEGKQKEEYQKEIDFNRELAELDKLKKDGAYASEEEYQKAVKLLRKKYFNKEKETEEEKWKTTQEFAQKTTDFFKQQSEKRISQMDKEISAAEKQADYYRELAANGNINAQQSLAEQERIIAESNRRKEREQKRQQRMELANTIYQTYAGHAAKDPETALMKTIKDASLLQAFISTLPMFYEGTEDTGKGGGVDGKGGFHAVLHPHERVIPKSLNDQIGSLSNEQLTRLAMEYNNGRLVGQDVAHSSMDLAVLVSKLDNLTEVIKQKPETNIELGQITQSAMEIVQSTRKGNTTVYNRFKVQK